MVNLMSSRNKRQRLEFDIGDYVRVNIPRVDRTGIDRRSLPVMEVLDGGVYHLGCAYGILGTCYQVFDLESISAEFPELENIPEKQISLTEAVKMQSSATVTGALCHCKSKCDSNRCPCK
ncbi:4879_t:CDS:1 [Paraglomus brasilianum]|uniref:4879_t:CDS:1 n=1 Tax=Paraglomus brasilianum TaxID=144538 RepID=A0A9N8VYA0_9GLOM|nr:4879_t:CDS:1 [Paraglomus brasilianum]